MRRFAFKTEQLLPRPLGEVFPFFADPRNLQAITPPWLDFEITTKYDLEMREGLLIDYRLRIRGIPLRWRSEITVWQPPHRFVDEQRRGSYRFWVHEHTFEAAGDSTRMGDHVQYGVPGGIIVQRLVIARDVARIFAFRRTKLEQIFDKNRLAGTGLRLIPGSTRGQCRQAEEEQAEADHHHRSPCHA